MRRILLIAFLLIGTSANAQLDTLRWEKNIRVFWENHIDAIDSVFWKPVMDAYVEWGWIIDSGSHYELVLPIMEAWPKNLAWFSVGNRIQAEVQDSLILRGNAIFGYNITRTDTLAVNPTLAEYMILSWDKRTRAKTKSRPPVARDKSDAYYVALYPRQGWMEASKRETKVKRNRRTLIGERKN